MITRDVLIRSFQCNLPPIFSFATFHFLLPFDDGEFQWNESSQGWVERKSAYMERFVYSHDRSHLHGHVFPLLSCHCLLRWEKCSQNRLSVSQLREHNQVFCFHDLMDRRGRYRWQELKECHDVSFFSTFTHWKDTSPHKWKTGEMESQLFCSFLNKLFLLKRFFVSLPS